MEDLQQSLAEILNTVLANDELHAKWLNSLSLMENTGARKISKYEHPVKTGIIVLKHAAEEARHAYYLKKQIEKVAPNGFPDYTFDYLLAPLNSYRYLHQLDVAACRYLMEKLGLQGREMYHGAYLLVTYAIEVRADLLYGVYQEVLTAHKSKVNVKSIILEEEGHLEEMTKMLQDFRPNWQQLADDMCTIEDQLFKEWLLAVKQEIAEVPAA